MMKKFYIIVGLGATGLSCARYLSQKNISFIIVDDRKNPPKLADCQKEFPHAEICLGEFSEHLFLQSEKIVISPGVSLEISAIQAALKNNVPVVSDIELFAQSTKKPIIAITGSNGKSTLVTLMGELIRNAGLKSIVCGNIGLPVLDALLLPQPDYYVVELSSFQLETTYSLKAKCAVVINISPDHLERHKTEKAYLAAKKRIYHHAELCFVNLDEPFIWNDLSFQHSPIGFTLNKPLKNQWGYFDNHLCFGDQKLISTSELFLQSRHQYQNMLSALAMGNALTLPMDNMLKTLKNFKGLAHRCQLVHFENNIKWFDDSKATNVGAAIAGIQSIGQLSEKKIILIAGGDSKGVILNDLKLPVKQYVSDVILFGKDADALKDVLKNCANIIRVQNMQEAVRQAASLATVDSIVLLSPACSSLDMYSGYDARGDDFTRNVKAYYEI